MLAKMNVVEFLSRRKYRKNRKYN